MPETAHRNPTAPNPVLVASLARGYAAAIRAEENATTDRQAWRLAAASERALRCLQAARAGQPLPESKGRKLILRGMASKGLAALAAIGRTIARAVREALRINLGTIAHVALCNAGSADVMIEGPAHSSIRYVRCTLHDSGQRFYLRVTSDKHATISGIEVDRDGEEVVPPGFDNRLRIVEKTSIATLTEMRMNLHYATLEAVRS